MACSAPRVAFQAIVLSTMLTHGVMASSGEPARLVGPFAKEEYPQAVIDRPLTLPAGMVEGEVGATFASARSFADDWDADVAVRVGITDRLQLEAATFFSLDHRSQGRDFRSEPTSWLRAVPVRLSLLALDTETLDTALTLTLPFQARVGQRVIPFVAVGAPTRWRLTDWLWLRAGEDLFRVTTADGTGIFDFTLGLGLQPHPLFAVTLDSRIATLAFDGDGHEDSRTVADDGTIVLQGVFSPCRYFDVVGGLDLPDAGQGFDFYAVRMGIRFRI